MKPRIPIPDFSTYPLETETTSDGTKQGVVVARYNPATVFVEYSTRNGLISDLVTSGKNPKLLSKLINQQFTILSNLDERMQEGTKEQIAWIKKQSDWIKQEVTLLRNAENSVISKLKVSTPFKEFSFESELSSDQASPPPSPQPAKEEKSNPRASTPPEPATNASPKSNILRFTCDVIWCDPDSELTPLQNLLKAYSQLAYQQWDPEIAEPEFEAKVHDPNKVLGVGLRLYTKPNQIQLIIQTIRSLHNEYQTTSSLLRRHFYGVAVQIIYYMWVRNDPAFSEIKNRLPQGFLIDILKYPVESLTTDSTLLRKLIHHDAEYIHPESANKFVDKLVRDNDLDLLTLFLNESPSIMSHFTNALFNKLNEQKPNLKMVDFLCKNAPDLLYKNDERFLTLLRKLNTILPNSFANYPHIRLDRELLFHVDKKNFDRVREIIKDKNFTSISPTIRKESLMQLIGNGELKLAEEFINAEPNLRYCFDNSQMVNGNTILHAVISSKNPEKYALLLKLCDLVPAYIDQERINIFRTNPLETPMDLAISKKDFQSVKILHTHFAKITPIQQAMLARSVNFYLDVKNTEAIKEIISVVKTGLLPNQQEVVLRLVNFCLDEKKTEAIKEIIPAIRIGILPMELLIRLMSYLIVNKEIEAFKASHQALIALNENPTRAADIYINYSKGNRAIYFSKICSSLIEGKYIDEAYSIVTDFPSAISNEQLAQLLEQAMAEKNITLVGQLIKNHHFSNEQLGKANEQLGKAFVFLLQAQEPDYLLVKSLLERHQLIPLEQLKKGLDLLPKNNDEVLSSFIRDILTSLKKLPDDLSSKEKRSIAEDVIKLLIDHAMNGFTVDKILKHVKNIDYLYVINGIVTSENLDRINGHANNKKNKLSTSQSTSASKETNANNTRSPRLASNPTLFSKYNVTTSNQNEDSQDLTHKDASIPPINKAPGG